MPCLCHRKASASTALSVHVCVMVTFCSGCALHSWWLFCTEEDHWWTVGGNVSILRLRQHLAWTEYGRRHRCPQVSHSIRERRAWQHIQMEKQCSYIRPEGPSHLWSFQCFLTPVWRWRMLGKSQRLEVTELFRLISSSFPHPFTMTTNCDAFLTYWCCHGPLCSYPPSSHPHKRIPSPTSTSTYCISTHLSFPRLMFTHSLVCSNHCIRQDWHSLTFVCKNNLSRPFNSPLK